MEAERRPDVLATIRDWHIRRGAPISEHSVMAAAGELGLLLGGDDPAQVVAALTADLVGLGPLQPLLELPGLTDIFVNGPDRVWVHDEAGMRRSAVRFASAAAVRQLAQRLASRAGERIDDARPIVDAQLSPTLRLNAVLTPVAAPGTLLSIRVQRTSPLRLDDLVRRGSLGVAAAGLLRRLVATRLSVMICGPTGAGKTSLLSAMIAEVPARERVLLVEETPELYPQHPHVVSLRTRSRNADGYGDIGVRDLIRQAVRMRPDRIVVGEVRGAEIIELLSATNSGHPGLLTVHANHPTTLPARLTALGALAGMSQQDTFLQVSTGYDAAIGLAHLPGGLRRVLGVWGWAEHGLVPVWSFESGNCELLAPGHRIVGALS
ncbi:MAG: TadA family conjugal transfer-associated ATPase [Actinobacteria bacterium]|nr:TadA family conjugal transfer-associated ATPase [Actinomycetota bacterium]